MALLKHGVLHLILLALVPLAFVEWYHQFLSGRLLGLLPAIDWGRVIFTAVFTCGWRMLIFKAGTPFKTRLLHGLATATIALLTLASGFTAFACTWLGDHCGYEQMIVLAVAVMVLVPLACNVTTLTSGTEGERTKSKQGGVAT